MNMKEHYGFFNLHQVVGIDTNLQLVRHLLSIKQKGYRMNLNQRDTSGNVPLHRAAHSTANNARIIKELIDSGADVNLTNCYGLSPLHSAVMHRKRQMIDILLQNGADINAASHSGTRALHYAINNTGYVYYLYTNLYERISPGTPDLNIIRRLLESQNLDIDAVDMKGETPLMWAAAEEHVCVVKLLLAKGADPNTTNIDGDSPLHKVFAGSRPCIDTARLLLRHGADICSLDAKNKTPIDILIERIKDKQSLQIAKQILKLIAFQNNSNKVKKNLKMHRELLHFYEACCEEVECMKYQLLSQNLTVYDFLLGCYNENEFPEVLFDIYKPLFNILITRCYLIYLIDILRNIDNSELRTRLEKLFYLQK